MVGHSEAHVHEQSRRTHHDMSHILIALVAIASLSHNFPCADALSMPGRRLFRRHATSMDTEIDQELYRVTAPDEEPFDQTDRSPAFTSSLFTSLTYRQDKNSRQRIVTQHRRKLFQREDFFQLNYQDFDDDMLSIIESQQPLSVRIFRGWKQRKSLSKALFPPISQESNVSSDLESIDQFDLMPVEEETYLDVKTPAMRPIGIGKITRKKKKNQVVVSNIQELHEAILDRGLELRDVELNYSPPPSLLTSKKRESSDSEKDSTLFESDEIQLALMTNELNPDFINLPQIELIEIELDDDDRPNAEEWQLIGNVLAEDSPFLTGDASEAAVASSEEVEKPFSHDCLNLLHQRYHSHSSPMSRAANDTAKLALSIEGGGMRGAVSGGMAAAIACLGLSNAFDSIYGSSAGSIIGSYFVSRQLYLDVYTDVIPAGKDLFVSKPKIIGDIFRNMFHVIKGPLGKRLNANLLERFGYPAAGTNSTMLESLPPTRAGGLNISFVLDTIMCPERGLRPLDLEAFAHNDAVQNLRIVSSAVELETGKLTSICFGSKEGHFRDQFANPIKDSSADSSHLYPELESAEADENGYRRGLWACLGASMTVPGAAGSPFRMDLPSDTNEPTPHLCFDAFCYEPVPFRSAVAEGATHVVALRSRPAGYEPKTKPTLYERAVAPLYFRSNGVPDTVTEFFEKGGQQYLYAEDVLICDQGLDSSDPIPIPPAKVLYAAPKSLNEDGISSPESTSDKDREKWARAHILPVTVPADVPELACLSQDRDHILAGIRSGFAAAYDALAPVVGLQAGPDSLDGMTVAELVFPDAEAAPHHESVLQKRMAGEKLGAATEKGTISASTHVEETAAIADLSSAPRRYARFRKLLSVRRAFSSNRSANVHVNFEESSIPTTNDSNPTASGADALLSLLPGVTIGNLPLVAERLQTYLESHSYFEG